MPLHIASHIGLTFRDKALRVKATKLRVTRHVNLSSLSFPTSHSYTVTQSRSYAATYYEATVLKLLRSSKVVMSALYDYSGL